MKRVQSRADLKHKILLALGHPYINVNLTDEHLDMSIDNALRYFFKYSPYGAFENFYLYNVGDADVANNYIPVPRWIDAVIEILPNYVSLSDMSFATAEYQMSRETFMAAQRFNNVSLVDYVTLKARLQNTMDIINGPMRFQYVRYQRRLIPHFTLKTGTIALKVYENANPENVEDGMDPSIAISADDLWDDETLLQLAVAQAKMIWGNILKKFGQVVLPGGVTLDGQKLFEEGKSDFDTAGQTLIYSNPVDFFMG